MIPKIIEGNIKVTSGGYLVNCIWAIPSNYDATKSYPLILSGHGTGEASPKPQNIALLYNNGLPNVLKSGFQPPFDCIICCPQAESYGLATAWILPMLADAQSRYNIDKTRIHLGGYSAGGLVTYGSQTNEPTSTGILFASLHPLSGATQDVIKSGVANFKTTQTPIWATAGALDTSYVQNNQDLINSINAIVSNLAQFTIIPNTGHGGWIQIYNGSTKDANGKTVWDFMAAHTRGAAVPLPPAPVINSVLTITATQGTTVNYQITATNNPTSYNATGLPTGLSVNATTGLITGTSTVTGVFNVTVTATNSGGSGSALLSVTILIPKPTITQTITIDVYSDGTTKIH